MTRKEALGLSRRVREALGVPPGSGVMAARYDRRGHGKWYVRVEITDVDECGFAATRAPVHLWSAREVEKYLADRSATQ